MTALIDDSCSTTPQRARLAPVLVAFLLGTMAREMPGGPAAGLARRPPAAAEVALTQGETRVLHYLPTNLSAREIARELFLSVNTIKTHQRHLYAKLGARSRSQAVERARALGLLAQAPRRRLPGVLSAGWPGHHPFI
jgi:LuxR family transcriptional regulator, maltose regulon positive regulatory protein